MNTKVTKREMFSDKPEIEYSSLIPYDERKNRAVFTPFQIAEFMSEWIVSNDKCKTILDPAVGLGIFFRAIISRKGYEKYRFVGYDIDDRILNYAKAIFNNIPDIEISLEKKDYLFNDWTNQYDGIVCNPPYLKFHDYENKQILSVFEKKLKMRLTGFTNIYTLFFLKSMNQLSEDGRAAYIVPYLCKGC
ncbi:N-6 DNA methylase [Peptococcaceae bacterium]|nr:N-6 DNA methylase [Peptococcaceae bacterium]